MGSNVFKEWSCKGYGSKKVGAASFEIASNEFIKYKGNSVQTPLFPTELLNCRQGVFKKEYLESITIPCKRHFDCKQGNL